ncbi:MAG: hydroxyethylthiazole kinase [Methanomassiliicoccaceae archaeon]
MPILVKKNASSFERSSGELLATLREKHPLVHHITNYVTVNDCANITLCIGASPVMAEAKEEVEEMVSMAGALVLNIGTLRKEQVEAMLIAGRRANEHSIPVILDPVGAGATSMRTNAARRLLEELDVAVIKGNAGEIGVLAGSGGVVRGVDSGGISGDPMIAASRLANATGSVVVMSGATDIITDGTDAILVDSGHPLMGAVSGTGCMASSLVGSFAAVADDLMISSAAALVAFGIAGERAARNAIGPASFKIALLDAVAALKPEDMKEAKVREVSV